jgi:hypothetical protein
MADRLKTFEWLMYGWLALGIISMFLGRPPIDEMIAGLVLVVIVAGLVWLVAHKGMHWAIWLIVLFVALDAVVQVVQLGGASKTWLPEIFRPETPPTTAAKAVDALGFLLAIVGLYFYFTGNRQAARA